MSIFISTESNRRESCIDRSGQKFQSPAGFLEEKLKTLMYIYIFWSSLQIFRSNTILSHLDQESERLDINLSKI